MMHVIIVVAAYCSIQYSCTVSCMVNNTVIHGRLGQSCIAPYMTGPSLLSAYYLLLQRHTWFPVIYSAIHDHFHQEKWFLPFLALYPNRDSMGYISIYMRYSCNLSDIELDFHYIL